MIWDVEFELQLAVNLKQVRCEVSCNSYYVYFMCGKLVKHIYVEHGFNMNQKPLNWWCNSLSQTDLTHDFIITVPICLDAAARQFSAEWLLSAAELLRVGCHPFPARMSDLNKRTKQKAVEFMIADRLMMSPDLSALTDLTYSRLPVSQRHISKWIILWASFTLSLLRTLSVSHMVI